MDIILGTISELKSKTESLISDINQLDVESHISERALDVLLKVVELEQRYKQSLNTSDSHPEQLNSVSEGSDNAEIKKVKKKLLSWANVKKQGQINTRILNLYLELVTSKGKEITVDEFREAYQNDVEFLRNYPQMKIISPKNHCKVFDEKDKIVHIWRPVKSYVDEYKKTVLSLSNGE